VSKGLIVKRLASEMIVAMAIVLIAGSVNFACTVFSFAGDGVLLFGNNEDFDRLEPRIWFLTAREPYHGVLCLGFDEWALQGGMNDAGLCYDATAGTAIPLNWHKELPSPPPNWLTLVLQRCATVDEVEAFVRQYDFSSSGMAQFLWLDRNGDSLIITSGIDGEVVFLKQRDGHCLITNFNVTDTSYGSYPCWRYETAEQSLRRLETGASKPSISCFRSILNSVHIPNYTAYSNIFDLASLTAYVYQDQHFRDVRAIDLLEVLAEGPPPPMLLSAYFESTASD